MTALPSTVLTLDEAAAYLKVAPDVLRLEAEAGRTPGKRLADDWRFSEDAIRAWLSTPASPESNGHCVPQVEWNAETEREAEEFIKLMQKLRDSDPIFAAIDE